MKTMESPAYLPKVTAFVTRTGSQGAEMLFIQHPNAGVQFPAGTVEPGEFPEQAVLREVAEETGLTEVRIVRYLGMRDELPPGVTHVVLSPTNVYARPDPTSITWAAFPRGIGVEILRGEGGYAQIRYQETDRSPDPSYISYQITGWVMREALASANRRYFYHLESTSPTPTSWSQFSDHQRFQLFWSPLDHLPEIHPAQRSWLDYVTGPLGSTFG